MAEDIDFHPAMFQRAIDWDGALIKVLPEVEAASDPAYAIAFGDCSCSSRRGR
jgi:hypothetical protein